MILKNRRCKREQNQADKRQYGGKLYRFRDIEFMGKEGENQIDPQLRAKINENEKSKQRIRDPVRVPKGQKKQRG